MIEYAFVILFDGPFYIGLKLSIEAGFFIDSPQIQIPNWDCLIG